MRQQPWTVRISGKRIRYIDIPSIMPTAVILLIMSCGHILTIGYEKVLLLQNDLNMATSDIISTYVYRIGLSGMHIAIRQRLVYSSQWYL